MVKYEFSKLGSGVRFSHSAQIDFMKAPLIKRRLFNIVTLVVSYL